MTVDIYSITYPLYLVAAHDQVLGILHDCHIHYRKPLKWLIGVKIIGSPRLKSWVASDRIIGPRCKLIMQDDLEFLNMYQTLIRFQ